MSGKQQGLRYFQKFLNSKASERNALAKKVLRYVMAVGFVLSPWLGGEAYAAETGSNPPPGNITLASDTNTNLMVNKVAHIYAQNVDTDGKVGFNHFTTFKVENGEIANLYFQKDSKSPTLNALVNTVDTQISISGVVNGIRNNTIGGKLYFLSPKGMIVGSTGVINAGALTIVAPESINGINDANAAASKVVNNVNWGLLAEDYTNNPVKVTINGQINTATGIDIQAMTVEIKKAGSTTVPTLLTGVVFKKAVNSGFSALPISNNRLQLKKDQKGNLILDAADDVSVADPSNQAGSENLNGNGMINIYSKKDLGSNEIGGKTSISEAVLNAIGKVGIESGTAIEIDKSLTGTNTNSTSITAGYQIRLLAERSDFYNYGTISGAGAVSLEAGRGYTANIINGGTIQSTDVGTSKSTATGTTTSTSGGIGITAHNSVTNEGTISASSQITFSVPDSLTNTGTINSTGSNVQVHIGRDFKNNAVYGTDSSGNTVLTGGIITAGGNVQVDYTLPSGMTAVSTGSTPDGIFNSGLIQATGNRAPSTGSDGTIDKNTGSGNIWLTSSYNITNRGTMNAERQITLNARDFLDNYGTIQGVTYLDIKSIMGCVYNHDTGRIISTGGNIDLSSGQANLKIEGDKDGQKKKNYRKFTPIIIEGLVRATSDDDDNNQTKKGDIKITAHLGDIYVVGGTIETKPEVNDGNKVVAEAGDVILDAAQNITIGFNIDSAKADDPTTDGENANKKDEKDYFLPNLQEPSGKNITIFGTNITLKSGSKENNYIRMSNTETGSDTTTGSNTLTASKAVTIDTTSMDITAGTINASTLNATGGLNITGGTVNASNVTAKGALTLTGGSVTSTGNLTISGNKGLTIDSGAGISTGGDLTATSTGGSVVNNHVLDITTGSVILSGNTGVTNNAKITSSSGIGMTSAEGTIVNDAKLTAKGGAVSFESKGDITNNAAIEANGSVHITSTGGSVINKASITAGQNFATPSAVSFYSLRAMARAVDTGSVVISGNGSVTNNADLTATGGSVIISGSSGIENTANITASNDVSMTSSSGSISNSSDSTVTATGGSVSMSGGGDVTSGNVTGNDVVLTGGGNVTGGTITGDGSVSMTGGGNVTCGTITGNDSVSMTGGGNVAVGTVTGSDVAITGGSDSDVNVDNITVDNSLKLQGDNITATNVNRSDNATGALNVDVSGADGTGSTAQGDVNLKIYGNVVFDNLNVTDAKIETSGTLDATKLHVEGKAEITSSNTTVNVYGKDVTPDPNDTTAIQDKGDGNTGWLTLKIGDTGVQSTFVGDEAKTDYPVQLSGKLVDYDPYDTYLEQYGDVADVFGRTDLVVASESPSGAFAQGGVVVLKQDADGLRIEEEKKEE